MYVHYSINSNTMYTVCEYRCRASLDLGSLWRSNRSNVRSTSTGRYRQPPRLYRCVHCYWYCRHYCCYFRFRFNGDFPEASPG